MWVPGTKGSPVSETRFRPFSPLLSSMTISSEAFTVKLRQAYPDATHVVRAFLKLDAAARELTSALAVTSRSIARSKYLIYRVGLCTTKYIGNRSVIQANGGHLTGGCGAVSSNARA